MGRIVPPSIFVKTSYMSKSPRLKPFQELNETTHSLIEKQKPQTISEPKKFDDFDWDKNFSEAYK